MIFKNTSHYSNTWGSERVFFFPCFAVSEAVTVCNLCPAFLKAGTLLGFNLFS